MKLTFEKTRGTRTIYFPLESSSDYPPDFVVVIRPFQADPGEQFDETDEFEAGIAVCNPADHFVKRQGRAIAFERLNSSHRLRGDANSIINTILKKITQINIRRDAGSFIALDEAYVPDMDEEEIEHDLRQVMCYEALAEYFLKKDEHRKAQAQVA